MPPVHRPSPRPTLRAARPLKVASSLLIVSALVAGACTRRPVKETRPITNNVFIERVEVAPIDKIDLLFVVDNSTSMADKQKILEQAVPKMLRRLVQPDCVLRDGDRNVIQRVESTAPSTPGGDPSCTGELVLEFNPVKDIHIGVISSSLGGSGSDSCNTTDGSDNDDRGLLMPKVRPDLVDPHGTGFLVWRPPQGDEPAGTPIESDLDRLTEHFRDHILAVGEKGCGFEAPLEAQYRFLVDPSPPLVMGRADGKTVVSAIDQEILDQRAAFLRPDSLVGIVLVTDENDCSIMQGGEHYPFAKSGWRLAQYTDGTRMPAATKICETNPNDACCFSCFLSETPSSCKDPSAIQSCTAPGEPRLPADLDNANVRCHDGLRRFGLDLLYPVERYINGLTAPSVINSQTGVETPNPLLTGIDGSTPRRPGMVFFSGIAGVPWQDLATANSLKDDTELSYLRANRLNAPSIELGDGTLATHWDLMLGSPGESARSSDCQDSTSSNCGVAPTLPLDPFMIESIDARSGTNPLTGDPITVEGSWNPINGHEQNNSYVDVKAKQTRDDLQYSCIFPLEPYGGVKDCKDTSLGCDCGSEPSKGRPLCRESASDPAGTVQHWGKAYPSSRILEVLKGFGANSIPASICPKIHDPINPDYGYNPAVAAIIDRLAERLGGTCLPRQLALNDQDLVDCVVVEAMKPEDGQLDCGTNGGTPMDDELQKSVADELERAGWCDKESCKTASFCSITQLEEAAAREACLTRPIGSESSLDPGFCYIDAAQNIGNAELVAACPPSQRQLLRFVGKDTPAPHTTAFVACTGDLGDVKQTGITFLNENTGGAQP